MDRYKVKELDVIDNRPLAKNVVLKELKQNGYLNCESDRFTRSRKNSLGYTEDVYVIKLPKEQIREEEDFEQEII